MAISESYVRARIDNVTKQKATEALKSIGLSVSDAIRLLLNRVAAERALPFDLRVPNAETRDAMSEVAAGNGKRFATVDALLADLHADD